MSEHLDWAEAWVEWTPEGHRLTLPIQGDLTERYLLAIHGQLRRYSLGGLWKEAATLHVSPLGDKIQITTQGLFDADPRLVRQRIDEGVTAAIAEVDAAFDREREPGQKWLDTLRAPLGED